MLDMNNVEHFKKLATELGELYEKKNTAYNNSFGDTYNKLGIISAVTRISDKYNRLCNLATNPDIDNLGESLEDTLRDMASYCIMTVMELENAKPCGINPIDGSIVKVGDMENISEKAIFVSPPNCRGIREGDVFECIQEVCINNIRFRKGETYQSYFDNYIANEQAQNCYFKPYEWEVFFKRI